MKSWQKLQNMMENHELQVFIVGGYVRDRLLERETKDHDFVVIGSTPQLLLDIGMKQVGADFPVFLNENGDEFALARTERKSGKGYHGFDVDFSPSVTLEDDLFRRDFTVNAMARRVVGWNEHGHAKLDDHVIDPYGGSEDLRNGIIRHVSDHVRDDPLRVVRAARFAARYNFQIHDDTVSILRQVSASGELDHLPAERFWVEFEKAATADNFGLFVHYLNVLGVLEHRLYNVFDHRVEWYDFKDSFQEAPDRRLAELFANQPRREHIDNLAQAIKMPNDVRDLMNDVWLFINVDKDRILKDPVHFHGWCKRMNVAHNPTRMYTVLSCAVDFINAAVLCNIGSIAMKWSKIKAKNLLTQTELSSMVGVEIGKTVEQARLTLLHDLINEE